MAISSPRPSALTMGLLFVLTVGVSNCQVTSGFPEDTDVLEPTASPCHRVKARAALQASGATLSEFGTAFPDAATDVQQTAQPKQAQRQRHLRHKLRTVLSTRAALSEALRSSRARAEMERTHRAARAFVKTGKDLPVF